MVKSPHLVMSIEPFPGGRLARHWKGGQPHITIQVSGDVLAAALRQLDPESPEPHRARRSPRDADNRRVIAVQGVRTQPMPLMRRKRARRESAGWRTVTSAVRVPDV
jgi:hypothetical protein